LVGSSPLTTSTWSGTSATPTDKESVLEDPEEVEDEEDRRARGGEGVSEEDVGRDKVDITNLRQSRRLRQSKKTIEHLVIRTRGERSLGYQSTHKEKAQCLGTVGTTIYRA